MGDVIRAQESRDDASQMEGYETECHDIPLIQNPLLESHVWALATRHLAARIAFCADGSLDVWREVSAAFQEVLNRQPPSDTEVARPLGVDFAFEVEGSLFVRNVSGDDEEAERNPEADGVNGEEGAIVEENSGPTNERCEETGGSSNGRGCSSGGMSWRCRRQENDKEQGRLTYEFPPVAYCNNVGFCPDIEPD